jgi:beta-phosphoglucomutase-like phosphatase (HAD superfamily)
VGEGGGGPPRTSGVQFTERDRRDTLGRSIDDTVAVYADRLGHPASAVPALRAELIDLVKPLYLGVLPRPGAVAFVARLGARVPLAAASLSCVGVTG